METHSKYDLTVKTDSRMTLEDYGAFCRTMTERIGNDLEFHYMSISTCLPEDIDFEGMDTEHVTDLIIALTGMINDGLCDRVTEMTINAYEDNWRNGTHYRYDFSAKVWTREASE